MSKKKNKRNSKKYPCLEPKYNLKSRRDYIDSHHYLDGVEYNGKLVMPKLSDEAKQFLNDFNKEYYNASYSSKFGYNDVHECTLDEDTINDLKQQITDIKAKLKRIWNKSAEETTEADRKQAAVLNEQLEETEKFLNKNHPRRASEQANYRRNTDLFNVTKMMNLQTSWEVLVEEGDNPLDPELILEGVEFREEEDE